MHIKVQYKMCPTHFALIPIVQSVCVLVCVCMVGNRDRDQLRDMV